MPDEYRVSLTIERNGVALDGMPIIRRLIVNQDADISIVATADNNSTSFHPIAAAISPAMQLFLLQTDQTINLQINQSGTAAPLPITGGGLILIVGANLQQATPSLNIVFNNPGASTSANLSGLCGGT